MSYSLTLPDGTILGSITGQEVGTYYEGRKQMHDLGLHRKLMHGIASHGSSIVLSGGYVDDEDHGNYIIYTGEGGRDSETGDQIADLVEPEQIFLAVRFYMERVAIIALVFKQAAICERHPLVTKS